MVLLLGPKAADARDLSGPAEVVDGDTLMIHGDIVELWGYDAPELDQQCAINGIGWPCGQAAANHIQAFTKEKIVTCREKSVSTSHIRHFKCAVGTFDIGAEMIEVGLAMPDWPISARYYIRSYQEARGQGRGIHQGTFVKPWDWRKSQPVK